jgi:hypothetical protein
MPIRAVMTYPPDWVVQAFLDAVERAKAGAADKAFVRGIAIPASEALMWLDVLRQTDRDAGRGREIADALRADPLAKALVFVRARVHHHWAPIAYFDSALGEWVWLQADNLPLPAERFANRRGEVLYRKHLEGKPVLAALEEMSAKLQDVLWANPDLL